MTTIPALFALALSAQPAHASGGYETWLTWAAENRMTWVAKYELALASGNHKARVAILEYLAELLGISTSEAQQLLQQAMVTGRGLLGLLLIDGHTEDRRAAEWGDVPPDTQASMSIGIPHDPGSGRQGDGTVESECIGGQDEYGNQVDCGSWAISAPVEDVVDELGNPWCLAHVGDGLALAVAGECDEHAGQQVPPDALVYLPE